MVRKIVNSKDPQLRAVAKPIGRIDAKVKEIIKDLIDTLGIQKDPEGVGLAAPQIGKSLRVFVTNYHNFKKVFINPDILETHASPTTGHRPSVTKSDILEGCLSLPNYYSPVKRAASVKLKYLDENGKKVVETFSGFHAQIILHEIDHLNGILFIDRLLEQKKPLYKLEKDKWEEVELV